MPVRRTVSILAVLCMASGLVCAYSGSDADSGSDSPKELALALARKAKRADKAGDSAQAYIWYSEASALQPANRGYRVRMATLQPKAIAAARPAVPALDEPADPAPLDNGPSFDSLTEKEMAQARELNEVPSLKAQSGTQNFDLIADPRGLFDQVAAAFGLQTVFDGDFPRTGQQTRFHLSGVDYREALHGLEAATGSFVIPLSGRLFMVAQDTPAKRTDLEQTMAIAVPVPQAITTQELTELAQVVRQATNVEKIAWESTQSRIVMRDRVSRVAPAVALLNELLSYRPEVMIDLEFIQVAQSEMLAYGFNVSNSFSAYYLGHILTNSLSIPSTVTNLLTFGGGKTLIGITAAQVQAMFNESRATSNSLYSAQLRSVAGQPATLHVGEKYPVITGGYFGASTTTQSGQTYAPPPSFTFVDLGLEMKMTPFINGIDNTTLGVETSFQVINGQALNGIPIIGNRSLKSQVGLRNGEWAVIGTMANRTKSKGVTGFWGLAQLPFLGQLFRQTTTDDEESTVLIGVRTRLLSLPAQEVAIRALRVGSDTRPYSPL